MKQKINPLIVQTDSKQLTELLDSFSLASGITVIYVNPLYNAYAGIQGARHRFCVEARKIAAVDQCCHASDAQALFMAMKRKCAYSYACPMGLWETVIPIYIDQVDAGYFMMGQVKLAGEDSWPKTERKLAYLDVPHMEKEAVRAIYDGIPSISRERYLAAVSLLEMLAGYVVKQKILSIYKSPVVKMAMDYLDHHFSEKISLTSLADTLGISHTTLLMKFKAETGLSPIEYIERLRMNAALQQLHFSDLSVKEIANSCGYKDQNYFSRAFKKAVNLSPTQYREKAAGDEKAELHRQV